ncbi:MAG: metabolite traffic protein EboE [Actinomycetota bacterium]|jgi:hypothetical protein|nr:metabolite traffic protein EboE [Actinomycetota bacterium]
MQLPDHLGHLSYSTLVHPSDTWEELRDSLSAYVPKVKSVISPGTRFGVSLRLSGASATRLTQDASARRELAGILEDNDLYVYTVNAFPQGSFKGTTVKERVYEPDWSTEERLRYTEQVADLLAMLSPPDVDPSIQSAPLAFRPSVRDRAYLTVMTDNVLRVVAHLVELRHRTGRLVTLALEPEPYCYLESTDETIRFFQEEIHSPRAIARLAQAAQVDEGQAEEHLRRHLGVVFDIGHQSVGFEDVASSLAKLRQAEVPIFKLQEAAALWVPEVGPEAIEELERYARSIYLTQTTELSEGSRLQYLNLEDAIESWRRAPRPAEWRVHFHVPVFLDELGPFRSTRFAIEQALAVHRASPLSAHLEVETYTWDVLPAHLKTGDIVDYVARELDWVIGQLETPTRAGRP